MSERHARLTQAEIQALVGVGASCGMWAAFTALALHANADGFCFPSLTTLERVSGLERRRLTRSLKELEQKDLIARDKRGTKVTHYHLKTVHQMPLAEGETGPELGAPMAAARGSEGPQTVHQMPPRTEELEEIKEQQRPDLESRGEIVPEMPEHVRLIIAQTKQLLSGGGPR